MNSLPLIVVFKCITEYFVILQRPIGLFSLLEEECMLARTTDMTFVDKLTKSVGKNDLFKKSKHRDPIFALVHFAGLVRCSFEVLCIYLCNCLCSL